MISYVQKLKSTFKSFLDFISTLQNSKLFLYFHSTENRQDTINNIVQSHILELSEMIVKLISDEHCFEFFEIFNK